ncbi:hypothetical protein [Citrobacter phage vB_CfrS_K1M]
MKEVKTYAVNCNDAWLNTKGDDISGSYVKYADYLELAVQLANAESKCREMAAENVALNDKTNRLATWPGIEFYSSAWEFCNLDGNDALEFMCDVKIPASDAFLAEVRAQGVELCADSLLSTDDIGIDSEYQLMREFAAQLRQEATQ